MDLKIGPGLSTALLASTIVNYIDMVSLDSRYENDLGTRNVIYLTVKVNAHGHPFLVYRCSSEYPHYYFAIAWQFDKLPNSLDEPTRTIWFRVAPEVARGMEDIDNLLKILSGEMSTCTNEGNNTPDSLYDFSCFGHKPLSSDERAQKIECIVDLFLSQLVKNNVKVDRMGIDMDLRYTRDRNGNITGIRLCPDNMKPSCTMRILPTTLSVR